MVPPSTVRRRGIDEIVATDYDKENDSPSPPKRALFSYDGNADDKYLDCKYSTVRSQFDNMDDMTEDLNAGPPSSPFQFDARDDTVDMDRLQAMTAAPSRVKSPRDVGPVVYVDEEDGPDSDRHSEASSERIFEETDEVRESHTTVTNEMPEMDDQSIIHHHAERSQIGSSMIDDRHNEGMSTVAHGMTNVQEHDFMDDTCLSTFSAVPNVDMTLFAKLRGSPTKRLNDIMDPSASVRGSPYSHRANPSAPNTIKRRGMDHMDVSPTPQKRGDPGNGENADLLDFTDSVNYFRRVSQRFSTTSHRASVSPRRRSPLKPRESMRSPSKYNLLDFDLPPPSTPMSVPSITPRELESLKSGFLSEISSLKATLSGKEAEVGSLKQAVSDAEHRVAEALEEVRNEAIRKEALEVEQAEWERRGKEMESVLRQVRSEIIDGERERERLTRKGEEAERHREDLEGRIVELESQLDASRKSAPTDSEPSVEGDNTGMITAEQSAKEVQEAVERVARELHTLYKGKHETKVAALKKSYESRWGKRLHEAENKYREATDEIDRLKTERDTTMSGPVNPNMSVLGRDNDELEAENKVLGAQIKGLEQQITAVKNDNKQLHTELKMERAEKGELVAAVDEWLAIQQHGQQQQQQQPPQQTQSMTASREPSISSTHSSTPSEQQYEAPLNETDLMGGTESESLEPPQPEQPVLFKRSISRTGLSGLRPPSSGIEKKSRLGMYNGGGSTHSRQHSGGRSGIAMPTPGRSGIMSSIERMGRGGN
jgi:hypothetical protein